MYFTSESNSPELDMSILAACNHSIVDYGSFGFWASYLAAGRVVILAGRTRKTELELGA